MFAFESPHAKRNYNLSEIATKSGFKFRDITNRKLDWKTLGCVDVNKVIDNQDYEFLERIIPKLIEAPMQSILSTAILDPAVSSLFRLAQLSLQYLSFCQQFMDHTLYDLRAAFNHLQKKYSNLKHNYKCLEEQHYKAQERIQQLLASNGIHNDNKIESTIVENHVKPTSLFPCDQCTKNFLTADSLRSHQQRKHSTIAEKHELSDDNEKGKDSPIPDSTPMVEKELKDHINVIDQENVQLNNNNNGYSNENCAECSKKMKVNSSSVAVQCSEVGPIEKESKDQVEEIAGKHTEAIVEKTASPELNSQTEKIASPEPEQLNKHEHDLIQTAYETINDLKKEILDLRNALNSNESTEAPKQIIQEPIADTKLVETNDKIEVMAQKFDAFEAMYTESQHQFFESFRNLDARQKNYMDNIQETVKEIVEKSLGKYEITSATANEITSASANEFTSASANEFTSATANEKIEQQPEHINAEKPKSKDVHIVNGFTVEKPIQNGTRLDIDSDHSIKLPTVRSIATIQESDDDWSSESEGKPETMICQADVHTVESASEESIKPALPTNGKKKSKKLNKEMAINEFEQRLRQLGVDADSVGLSTPRSNEVIQELADEREEMKKAHKSFKTTRNKLKTEVDRIAKVKVRSTSSVTSLSSHFSDDPDDLENEVPRIAKFRPKSASIHKIRKRNAKKLVKKYVDNDIDENDIMDKMEMAQKAINAHRECIQELLQTTAHAPNKIPRIKAGTAANESGQMNGENKDIDSNQYNKMPNVTTRRVVFVNLDEDS